MQTPWVLNKRLLLVIIITLLLTLLFASPVMASRIISDETVVIGADEVIDDDVVFMGSKLVVDGTINGDLVAFGQEIVVNGTIEGDLLASGMTITLGGEVKDDVRAAGYLVKLTDGAVVGDEALLAGFSVETDAGSTVGSDVLMAGYQALLRGSIGGSLTASANGVQIEGAVSGDADLDVGDPADNVNVATYMAFNPQVPDTVSVPAGLTVGSSAAIAGDLTYASLGAGDVSSRAVEGRIYFNRQVPAEAAAPEFTFQPTRPGAAVGYFAGQTVLKLIRRFLTLALVGLLIVWLVPKLLTDTVQTFKARPWASLGIGALGYVVTIAALVLIPWILILIAILLGIISLGGLTGTVIGFGAVGWAGLLVVFVSAISWLAKVILSFWLGQLIWKAIQPEGTSLIPPLLIGVVIAAVLLAIPILGGLLGFIIALFGLGALILMVRGRVRPAVGEPAAEGV